MTAASRLVAGRAPTPSFNSALLARSGVETLLGDLQFVRLVRWGFTARLVCLALAAPSAMMLPGATAATTVSLALLTLFSLLGSRSDRLIRILIRHPLLASVDVAIGIALLTSIDIRQPVALTVVCSALLAGLLFSRQVLVLLIVPLAIGSLGAPASVLGSTPPGWQAWLALVAGLPTIVVGVGSIGAVVRRNVEAMVRARHEVAEAITAVAAADERARLARDMHDSVGKSLHGISLGAKALGRVVARDPVLAGELASSLAESADQAAREARTLLVALREGQIDRPTVDVIGEVLADWEAETGVRARLRTVRAVDAAPEVTHQMAAALIEILHNVAKHAGANEVEVLLTGGPDSIELGVRDDGAGFDPVRYGGGELRGHFGLRGLRERAEQVGGDVEIESKRGEGTQIRWTALRYPEQS